MLCELIAITLIVVKLILIKILTALHLLLHWKLHDFCDVHNSPCWMNCE